MPSLTFYTNPMSRGRIARWMLEEVGAPYETVLLDYGTTMKAPAYLAVNPMGKVPAVKHGDTVVTECAAICAYLADAYPTANLAPPPGHADRGPYYRWLFFGAGPVEAAASNKGLGVVVPAEKQGMVGYGSLDAVTSALEQAVTGKTFIAGARFTAADLYLASQLGWLTHFGVLEKRPAFEAYMGPHLARPAAVRAREIDDAIIVKQQSRQS